MHQLILATTLALAVFSSTLIWSRRRVRHWSGGCGRSGIRVVACSERAVIKLSQNPVGNITIFPFQNNSTWGRSARRWRFENVQRRRSVDAVRRAIVHLRHEAALRAADEFTRLLEPTLAREARHLYSANLSAGQIGSRGGLLYRSAESDNGAAENEGRPD